MINIQSFHSSSKGNLYQIDDGKTKLLIECGVPIKKIKQALKFKLNEVAGCLCSHEHFDHSKAIRDLIKLNIPVYATKGTLEAGGTGWAGGNIIKYLKKFTVGTFEITAFETQHDADEPAGFLIRSKHTNENLLFLTDSYYCKYVFSNLNYIMIECNYDDKILRKNFENGTIGEVQRNRLLRSHMSLENCKKFLRSTPLKDVEKIVLLHLSDSNSDAARFKKEIIEETGKIVEIGGER